MKENYIGKNIPRVEGLEKALGKAKYAGDYYAENMLHVAVVRAEKAHAKIIDIDTSRVPEHIHVFTAQDIAHNLLPDIIEDQPVLAFDKVRFHQEAVALVAAHTEKEAKAYAQKVVVTYQDLPVVEDVHEALTDGSLVHHHSNLLASFAHEKGNVQEGFEACDLILEGEYETPCQEHGYMEPEASFTFIDEAGNLCARTSSQNVFHDRKMIARALGLSENQVKVKAAVVGGGFGGKDGHTNQIFSALVTWQTKKPARTIFSRKESLQASYKRHGAKMHVKMGFRQDGKILAFDGQGLLDTGAYAGLGPAVLGLFCEHFAGPYEIPHVKIDGKLIYTNKMPAHAFRGFGAPQGAFATETLINRAAKQLGIDPLEIRKMNALHTGAIGSLNQEMQHGVGFREALDLVQASALWQESFHNIDPTIGYGVAGGHLSCGLGKNIPDSAKVQIELSEAGIYVVRVGMVDIGQGSETALQAIAADALEVPIEQVKLVMADTEETFDCGSTAGSRTTYIIGNAILKAVEALKRGNSDQHALKSAIGSAHFAECDKGFDVPGFPHAMYTFLAQVVKVKVDSLTGKVDVLEVFSATEAGKVVNPQSLAGQMQGGAVMSLGYALSEKCIFEAGILKNSDFSTYLMPTAMDTPSIQSVHVDAYEHSGPMGVKGAAEVATVSIAPAIEMAVSEVIGKEANQLPLMPQTVRSLKK